MIGLDVVQSLPQFLQIFFKFSRRMWNELMERIFRVFRESQNRRFFDFFWDNGEQAGIHSVQNLNNPGEFGSFSKFWQVVIFLEIKSTGPSGIIKS